MGVWGSNDDASGNILGVAPFRTNVAKKLLDGNRALGLYEVLDARLPHLDLIRRSTQDALESEGAEEESRRQDIHEGLYQRGCCVDR